MLRTLLSDEMRTFRVVEDLSAISELMQNKDRQLWLDLEAPTVAEMHLIQEEFNLHPLAVEDAMARHQRPKIEEYDDFYLVVFYSIGIAGESGQKAGRRGIRATDFLGPHGGPGNIHSEIASLQSHIDYRLQALERANQSPDDSGEGMFEFRELTMFLGENYLITVHKYPVPEIEEAARRWQRDFESITGDANSGQVPGTRPLTDEERRNLRIPTGGNGSVARPGGTRRSREAGIGILLYSLLDAIVDRYFPVVDAIVDRIEVLEEQIFERYEQKSIADVFALKKEMLALRKVVAPERDVLNVLIRRDLDIFDPNTLPYFQDVYDHIVRITDSVDTYRDLLSSALDSFLTMQSNRLNVTVQTLTSVSIMLMSIAAVTGWYGMNFQAMPELSSPLGYPLVILTVAVVVALEYLFFKRKGWLK